MTTGIDWLSDPRPALVRTRRAGGHTGRGGIVGGAAAVIVVAVAALLWNASSQGGLIRMLGGVTSQDVLDAIAAHPGPRGPQGLRGPQGPRGPQGLQGPPGSAGPASEASPSAPVSVVRLVAHPAGNYEKSGPIAHSERYPVCTLSEVTLRRAAKHSGGSCRLTHGGRIGEWSVVTRGATCDVTCFSLNTAK